MNSIQGVKKTDNNQWIAKNKGSDDQHPNTSHVHQARKHYATRSILEKDGLLA